MKLFVLLSRVPYPIEKGDKLRAFHQLEVMAQQHEIVLCALSDAKIHPETSLLLNKLCKEVHIFKLGKIGMLINIVKAFFSGKPIQVGYFYRSSIQNKINKILEVSKPEHIFCQLIRVSEYVKNSPYPKSLDYMDVFSMGVRRRMGTSPWWLSPFLKMENNRLLKYENYIFDCFDQKIIISNPDRDLIPHPEKEKIVVIPNGVDYEYFSPVKTDKKYDLVFTGNMGYPPNIDAACYLVHEIAPLVRKTFPELRILIAGATPHSKVIALKSEYVTVSGWIPDIREAYSQSSIFIAPMRIGTGLQNKILEAMAMALPCITTTLPNDALGAKPEKEICIGDTATELAEKVVMLLKQPEKQELLAQQGHSFVKNNYSWSASTHAMVDLFKKSKQ